MIWSPAKANASGATETGMARLALGDDDKKARDWFCEEMSSLGCDVKVDAMGNTFAVRPGKNAGPPTAMGSHLDTQPTGGRYDGILGIHAAVEAMRTMRDAGYETKYPVAVVNWTNEEGARFPKSLHGSSVWAGDLSLEAAYALKDVADPSKTAGAELERIGYKGTLPADARQNPLAAHFELHIEQGPILEGEDAAIGVVSGGQAYKWLRCKISGRDSHAGTTPLAYRADAMLGAARIIAACHDVAAKHSGVATTGILTLEPGSINTIPHTVEFTIDIRHPDPAAVRAMEADIRTLSSSLLQTGNKWECKVDFEEMFDAPAAIFAMECRDAIREAAIASVGEGKVRELVSGAGHDSCSTSKHCPTGMVFVPCKDGASHTPVEYASPEACANGAQVLMDAALLFDSRREK